MQMISCTRSDTHTQHGDVWSSVSFMDSSWQSIFHLQGGYGKHLPRGFSCQTVTSQRPHKENEFVDVCQNPHILLVFSFYFSDFFCAMTSISGYKPWHNKKERHSSAITWYVSALGAKSDTLHPFCISPVFSCSLCESGTPSCVVWIKPQTQVYEFISGCKQFCFFC